MCHRAETTPYFPHTVGWPLEKAMEKLSEILSQGHVSDFFFL